MGQITKGEAIELLNNSIPYPEQMADFDLDKDDAIYFTWRNVRYKMDLNYLSFWEIENGCMVGGAVPILMGELVRKTRIIKEFK